MGRQTHKSCSFQTHKGSQSKLHARSPNCRENQNRKSRNAEQEKPAGFKSEKEWAEPGVAVTGNSLSLGLGATEVLIWSRNEL